MVQPAPPTDTMSADEIAQRLGVHPNYVYDKIRDKQWPCTRLGRKVRFTETDLADILRICRVDPVKTSTKKRSA